LNSAVVLFEVIHCAFERKRMAKTRALVPEVIETLIVSVRGEKVILDVDLAQIYGVSTKVLNQAIKRNSDRFPPDFLFQLTSAEWKSLRSQIVTSERGRGGRRYLPFALTEHGAIMAANVLNSKRAIQVSVFVVRAFVRMRGMFADNKELARRLAELEKELKSRLDIHETAIVGILQRIMNLIDPPSPAEPPKRRIGFGVEEPKVKYRAARR
jgi:phage regulator Rha-like protein